MVSPFVFSCFIGCYSDFWWIIYDFILVVLLDVIVIVVSVRMYQLSCLFCRCLVVGFSLGRPKVSENY